MISATFLKCSPPRELFWWPIPTPRPGHWIISISPSPLNGLSKAYATIHLNLGLEYKIKKMTGLIERYGAHGFIMHSNRSCKSYSLGQADLKREVSKVTGKPGLIIEADHTDSRSYAPKQVEKQIQIFLDIIRAKGSS